MARWRTLNKRAKRKNEREAEMLRNVEKLLIPAMEAIVRDAFKAAFAELAKSLNQMAAAWAKAGIEISRVLQPLDPRYGKLRGWKSRIEWPDVVLEDILDAEYIEG